MAFQIIRADITKVKADIIVNSANPDPGYGRGTDSAVYQAAGEEKLLKARKKIGRIEPGETAVTPAYHLPAKHIIHTVAPEWKGGDNGEEEILRQCYDNCLNTALQLKAESIAFPLLAAGVYGYPRPQALMTAVAAFEDFLADYDMAITLTVFDEGSFVLSGKIFSGVNSYIDDHYVRDKLREEYRRRDRHRAGQVSNLFGKAQMNADMAQPQEFTEEAEEAFFEEQAFIGHQNDAMMPPPTAFAMSEKAAAPQEKPKKKKRTLEEVIAQAEETWQESLFRLIDEKGFTDTEVYKRANIDRKLFSKIRSSRNYQPKKITAMALALSLRLSLDETKDFLMKAGFALSPGNVFDLIIEYFIEQEIYDTYTINLALFDHDQPLLGA